MSDRPGSETSPGITEHRPNIVQTSSGYFRTSSEHIPNIVRHIWTREARRVRERRSPDRGPYGPSRRDSPSPDRVPSISSRAVSPVAGHGGGDGRHVRYRPSPNRVRERPSPTPVSSHPGSHRRPHVSAVVTVGCAERPSSAMPRPNSACRRRRQRRFTNIYSCVWLWRSIVARSAARLRRTVGPLSHHGSCRTGTPITSLRHTIPKSPDITGHHRTSPDITGQSDIVGQKRVVACGRVCRRIVCRRVGRVRKEPVPDHVP